MSASLIVNDLLLIMKSWALDTCILVLALFAVFFKLLDFSKTWCFFLNKAESQLSIYCAGLPCKKELVTATDTCSTFAPRPTLDVSGRHQVALAFTTALEVGTTAPILQTRTQRHKHSDAKPGFKARILVWVLASNRCSPFPITIRITIILQDHHF